MDVEIDAAQHLDLAEGLGEPAQAKNGRAAHRQLRIAPMSPWRDSNATMMNSRPSTACQRSVQADRTSLRRMIAKAPTIGPDKRSRTADDHHQQNLTRGRYGQEIGADERRVVGEQRSAGAADCAGNHEGAEAIQPGLVTERRHALLIVANAVEQAAKPRPIKKHRNDAQRSRIRSRQRRKHDWWR